MIGSERGKGKLRTELAAVRAGNERKRKKNDRRRRQIG
jgi:hypothetical protein